MGSYSNNILVFTTHYNYLTKLAKDTKLFTNYKMEIIINKEDIKCTYKLKKGINKHYIALELLKKNGFDIDITEEAIKIKNFFLCVQKT
jgi:DNA mismatch repair ATPase MutS